MNGECDHVQEMNNLAMASTMIAELFAGNSAPPDDSTVAMIARIFGITPAQVHNAIAAAEQERGR